MSENHTDNAATPAANLFSLTNKTTQALLATALLASAAPALASDESFDKAKITDSSGAVYFTSVAIPDRLYTLSRDVLGSYLSALQARYPNIPFHVPQGPENLASAPEGTIFSIQPVGARVTIDGAEKATQVLTAFYLYALPSLNHLFELDESAAQNYLLKLHLESIGVKISNSQRSGDPEAMPVSFDDLMAGIEGESRGMPKLDAASRKTLRTIFGSVKSKAGYTSLGVLTTAKDMQNVLSSDSFAQITCPDISLENVGKVRKLARAYCVAKLEQSESDDGGYGVLITWVDWAERVHETRTVRGAVAEEEESGELDIEGLAGMLD